MKSVSLSDSSLPPRSQGGRSGDKTKKKEAGERCGGYKEGHHRPASTTQRARYDGQDKQNSCTCAYVQYSLSRRAGRSTSCGKLSCTDSPDHGSRPRIVIDPKKSIFHLRKEKEDRVLHRRREGKPTAPRENQDASECRSYRADACIRRH